MLNSLTHFLASQPPGQTVFLVAFVPGFGLTLAGFAIRHAMDVGSAKAWRR